MNKITASIKFLKIVSLVLFFEIALLLSGYSIIGFNTFYALLVMTVVTLVATVFIKKSKLYLKVIVIFFSILLMIPSILSFYIKEELILYEDQDYRLQETISGLSEAAVPPSLFKKSILHEKIYHLDFLDQEYFFDTKKHEIANVFITIDRDSIFVKIKFNDGRERYLYGLE